MNSKRTSVTSSCFAKLVLDFFKPGNSKNQNDHCRNIMSGINKPTPTLIFNDLVRSQVVVHTNTVHSVHFTQKHTYNIMLVSIETHKQNS